MLNKIADYAPKVVLKIHCLKPVLTVFIPVSVLRNSGDIFPHHNWEGVLG